jgi:DNA-binding transcriptional regulator GbsR (MarR family)
METSRKIPMEKLSENAERIWKVLSKYPKGVTARRLHNDTDLSKTVVYDSLKELESKDFVDHKNGLYITKGVTKEEPSTEAKPSRFGFFEWLDKRSERKRLDELAQARAEIDLLAKNYPSLQPLKEFSDDYKQKRKELGLE